MKKPNITEGTWEVHSSDNDLTVRSKEWRNSPLMADHHGCIVSDFTRSVGHHTRIDAWKESQANAKAISAVPEMIEALMLVKQMIGDEPHSYEENMMHKVDQALSKAGVTINEKAE